MRGNGGTAVIRHAVFGLGLFPIALSSGPLSAQATRTPNPPPPATAGAGTAEVVVTGDRRSVRVGINPVATLDTAAIAATGATTMKELLRAIRGIIQSADGSDPIFLLNGQPISGYGEIGTLPPEAIEKVEVLPEPVALRFGYPPTRRVLNFITKRRFRQTEVRGTAGTTTRGGGGTRTANAAITRLRNDGRLSLTLDVSQTDPLRQSDRPILPDPDIIFDPIGNVTGVNGGEIDPALSAAAGRVVTVAGTPDRPADRTLAGFAARANQARLFDLGPFRTLTARKDAVKGETILAGRIGGTLSGTISLSAERSRERNLAGPAIAVLTVPADNVFSPFATPVLLNRYLTEVPPLRQRQTTTTLHAGGTLLGVLAGWRWTITTAFDQQQVDGRSERGIDLRLADAAIAAGADPFAPLDPARLATRLVDLGRLRTRTAGMKTVATNTPFRLPAGDMSVTTSTEVERATAISATRGPNPFARRLGRDRIEGSLAIDMPLTSRRADVLPVLGDLSVNASAAARAVSGFGPLYDATYGLTWGPIPAVQLLATVRRTAAAPAVALQSSPEVRLANIPVFDFTNGRTELVTLRTGGNPDLAAERRQVRALTLNVKPFRTREIRIGATYEATTIRNQTGTVYALNPRTEALVPGLATRDASGRLVTVAYRPTNFFRQRQRTLNMTVTAYGMVGRAPPPADAGVAPPPDTRPSYYLGIGPTVRFVDRLQLQSGAPAFDLLRGDTVIGNGTARVSGYAYGGINQRGLGMTFDLWYGGAARTRSDLPAADLRFLSILKLNIGATAGLDRFMPHADWAKGLRLKIDINNVTDARPRVRDGNGIVPNRFQRDTLDPIGRMVTVSLRTLF